MSWVAVGVGVAGAAAGAYGASQNKSAAKDAIGAQQGAQQTTMSNLYRGQNFALAESSPYRSQGAAALPLLQYLATGQRPDIQFSDQENAELQDLLSQKNQLIELQANYGSRVGNKRLAKLLAPITAKLTRLDELQSKQAQYNALQGFTPESTGEEYLDQMRDYKLDLGTDPIYQAERAEMEKVLGRKYAAMGLNGSTAAGNVIAQNMVPLMQGSYSRGYGKLSDLFSKQNTLSQQQYNRIAGMEDSGRYGTTLATNAILGAGSNMSSVAMNPTIPNLIASNGANNPLSSAIGTGLNAYSTYKTIASADSPNALKSTYSQYGPYADGYKFGGK